MHYQPFKASSVNKWNDRPPAGTMLTTNLDMFSSKFLRLSKIQCNTFWKNDIITKQSTQSCEIATISGFNTTHSQWAPGQHFISVLTSLSQLSAMQIDSILKTLTPKWMSNKQTHFVFKQTKLIPVNKSNNKSVPNGIKTEWAIQC